ncbi:hypothetical protein CEXT_159471 [Caerostris extrusa]|uniref:Uncharacterized protein n=1 Tax=Caerostris extrusa TaxID=172846 RepID=A0AAV4T4J9_CAEEX|nr:hypothetical protein CEXT_159471 [Caerostris extrusa]
MLDDPANSNDAFVSAMFVYYASQLLPLSRGNVACSLRPDGAIRRQNNKCVSFSRLDAAMEEIRSSMNILGEEAEGRGRRGGGVCNTLFKILIRSPFNFDVSSAPILGRDSVKDLHLSQRKSTWLENLRQWDNGRLHMACKDGKAYRMQILQRKDISYVTIDDMHFEDNGRLRMVCNERVTIL